MRAFTFIIHLFILLTCTSCQVKEVAPEGDLISGHSSVTNKFTISPPASKTFIAGEAITFVLRFPFDIEIDNTGGNPRLELDVGSNPQYATLIPQANTKQLHFTYIISTGEADIDGIDLIVLDLNGSTLKFKYLGVLNDCDTSTVARKNFSGVKVDSI